MSPLFSNSKRTHRDEPHYFIAGLVLLSIIAAVVAFALGSFGGTFETTRTLYVSSDRAGLVMNVGAKVKMLGVTIGKVEAVDSDGENARLKIGIFPDELNSIPANVSAQINATTAFGAKYVALVPPTDPSGRIVEGVSILSTNVTTEVDTLFENLTGVLDAIDPAKVNTILGAISAGLRDRGEELRGTIGDGNRFLGEINPQMPTVRSDLDLTAAVANTYGDAAGDLVKILDNASITSQSVVDEQKNLDSLLVSAIGLGNSGSDLLRVAGPSVVNTARLLVPTTTLLAKYSPEYKCTLDQAVDTYNLFRKAGGETTGYSADLDVALLLGDDTYTYPKNLPKVAAKGGPGGAPGCYSQITKQNYPSPYLVMDTGASIANTTKPRLGSTLLQQYLFGPSISGGPR